MQTHGSKWWYQAACLALWVVAFKFGSDGITWFWTGQPFVAAALGVTAACFAVLALRAGGQRPPA